MNDVEEMFCNYYGKSYEKVKAAELVETCKMRDNFKRKYPNADMSKFVFQPTF
jgi:hypothetical protein